MKKAAIIVSGENRFTSHYFYTWTHLVSVINTKTIRFDFITVSVHPQSKILSFLILKPSYDSLSLFFFPFRPLLTMCLYSKQRHGDGWRYSYSDLKTEKGS